MENSIQTKLISIFNDYTQKLPARIQAIEELWLSLQAQWDPKKSAELLRLVHSLNGSAGLYGYMQLRQTAMELEITLSHMTEVPDQAQFQKILYAIYHLKDILQSVPTSEALNIFLKMNAVLSRSDKQVES